MRKKTEEKKIKLVITDRYCIANHKTYLHKETEFVIREISIDTARHYINLADIYESAFQITSDYMKEIYKHLIEGKLKENEQGILKIDENTSFLLMALNEQGQVKFYIIMDNNSWPTINPVYN